MAVMGSVVRVRNDCRSARGARRFLSCIQAAVEEFVVIETGNWYFRIEEPMNGMNAEGGR